MLSPDEALLPRLFDVVVHTLYTAFDHLMELHIERIFLPLVELP